MLFDDDPRDVRKKEFVKRMKMKKVWDLIDPLADKIEALRRGDASVEEIFSKAGYVGRQGEKLIGDFKKKPDVILAGIAMDENLIMTTLGELGVSVRVGSVTGVFSDAIIVPASADGTMKEKAAAMVREEGGEEIEKEAMSKAPIAPEKPVYTEAGELTCEHIIHTVAAEEAGEITPASVKSALSAALSLAEELEANTVAVPAAGMGADEPAGPELAEAIAAAINSHPAESMASIILVAETEEAAQALVSAVEKLEE